MPGLKRVIPTAVKRFIKIRLRHATDLVKGDLKKMKPGLIAEPLKHIIKSIDQPITLTATSEAKKKNLSIAISMLNNIRLDPGCIFSFWKLVGEPSEKKGYLKSRSIKGDQIQEETGGGLCQLSGLIYFLALHGGLTILERHPHSLDIYTEEERFTPLGSDATVVFGYKDLRVMNPYDFPVSLQFSITETMLTGKLMAEEIFEPFGITFNYTPYPDHTDVHCLAARDGATRVICSNRYKKMDRQS